MRDFGKWVGLFCLSMATAAAAEDAVPGTYSVATIRDWLIAAIPGTGNAEEAVLTDSASAYGKFEQQIASVQDGPSVGDTLTGNTEFDWRVADSLAMSAGEGALDLDRAIQPHIDNDFSTAYLVNYITSPDARTVEFFLNSDDSYSLWLNGTQVDVGASLRSLDNTTGNRVVLNLQQGKNALMAKVTESERAWAFSGRLTNAEGLLFSTDKNVDGAPIAMAQWTLAPASADAHPVIAVPPPHAVHMGREVKNVIGHVLPFVLVFVGLWGAFALFWRRRCELREFAEGLTEGKKQAVEQSPTVKSLRADAEELREMVAETVLSLHQREAMIARQKGEG